jgi:hypothetical protein
MSFTHTRVEHDFDISAAVFPLFFWSRINSGALAHGGGRSWLWGWGARDENRVLKERMGGRRLRFTDAKRRRLARKAQALGRKVLNELETLVTPDTLLPWYQELVASKWNYCHRRGPGRSRVMKTIVDLILRMHPPITKTRCVPVLTPASANSTVASSRIGHLGCLETSNLCDYCYRPHHSKRFQLTAWYAGGRKALNL